MSTIDAAEPGWSGHIGLVPDIVADLDLDWPHSSVLLCGPDVMMRIAADRLVDLYHTAWAEAVRMERYGPDEAVIDELIQVKGIGRWTAQMFLIFSLGRLDIFPHDDLGIRVFSRLKELHAQQSSKVAVDDFTGLLAACRALADALGKGQSRKLTWIDRQLTEETKRLLGSKSDVLAKADSDRTIRESCGVRGAVLA